MALYGIKTALLYTYNMLYPIFNYLNFNISNFGVTEMGSLETIIDSQQERHTLDDERGNDGELL